MMAERGVETRGWRELARCLDYSPAGLYRYFANREEILSLLAAGYGTAVLDSTHLRGFDAQFEQVHELALRKLVQGWRAPRGAGTRGPK